MNNLRYNRIRIMMVGPDTHAKGGIAKVISGYKKNGIFDKYNIEYYSTYKNGNAFHKILFYVVNLFKIIINLSKFNILHVHTASMWSFRRLSIIIGLGLIFNKKTIIHIHGGGFDKYYQRSSLIEKAIIRFVLNKSNTVITLSEISKRNLSKIVNPDSIMVVYNSVNDSFVKVSLNVYKDKKPFNIIFLGSLLRRKGVFDLIHAFNGLIKKNRNLRLILCGNGEVEKIKSLLKELKIENHVDLPGWVEGSKKLQLLDSSHVLVLPSYIEAFPMSILEAMARGVPVIATNVGGIEEIITDFSDGFIFNPGDTSAIGSRIELIYNDEKLYRSMCYQAKANVVNRFSTYKTLQSFEQLYS